MRTRRSDGLWIVLLGLLALITALSRLPPVLRTTPGVASLDSQQPAAQERTRPSSV